LTNVSPHRHCSGCSKHSPGLTIIRLCNLSTQQGLKD